MTKIKAKEIKAGDVIRSPHCKTFQRVAEVDHSPKGELVAAGSVAVRFATEKDWELYSEERTIEIK